MALFVFSSLPDWFRLFAYFLQSQCEGYAQLMLTKIYHWYAFTIGRIYNWYRFTVQSVEAFFQHNGCGAGVRWVSGLRLRSPET